MSAAIIDVQKTGEEISPALVREQGQVGEDGITKLGKLLLLLVGEPFQFARFSYAGELTLHFGTLRDASHPKLREKGLKYGTYVLRARGSGWLLKSGPKGLLVHEGIEQQLNPIQLAAEAVPITEKEIEKGGFITPDTVVIRPAIAPVEQVDGIALRLDMSDASSIFIVPTPDEPLSPGSPPLPELADWELETPFGTLIVGPGRKCVWSAK